MKEEIRILKNHIMFIDQCVIRLTVYEEVRKANICNITEYYDSKQVDDYLIREVTNFANNYDDKDDMVYTIIDGVNTVSLQVIIEALLWHYAKAKKNALEKLFLLS